MQQSRMLTLFSRNFLSRTFHQSKNEHECQNELCSNNLFALWLTCNCNECWWQQWFIEKCKSLPCWNGSQQTSFPVSTKWPIWLPSANLNKNDCLLSTASQQHINGWCGGNQSGHAQSLLIHWKTRLAFCFDCHSFTTGPNLFSWLILSKGEITFNPLDSKDCLSSFKEKSVFVDQITCWQCAQLASSSGDTQDIQHHIESCTASWLKLLNEICGCLILFCKSEESKQTLNHWDPTILLWCNCVSIVEVSKFALQSFSDWIENLVSFETQDDCVSVAQWLPAAHENCVKHKVKCTFVGRNQDPGVAFLFMKTSLCATHCEWIARDKSWSAGCQVKCHVQTKKLIEDLELRKNNGFDGHFVVTSKLFD